MGVIRRENVVRGATFSFADVEQEARALLEQARRQADQLLADAKRHGQARAKQAREEGYAAGLAEGRAAGLAQIREEAQAAAREAARADIDNLTAALSAALKAYEQQRWRLLAQAQSGLIELSLAIAARVCKRMAGASSDVAVANVRTLLEQVRHAHDVEISVHPDDAECMRAVAASLLGEIKDLEHVTVTPDARVGRGGCVLRTRAGVIDARIETQLDRVAEALLPPGATGRSDAAAPQPVIEERT